MKIMQSLLKFIFSLAATRKSNSSKSEISIDLELTNACNTSCIFCPRHRTPTQGFMKFETFKRVIERAKESCDIDSIAICGLGEPLLHPMVIDAVHYLSKQGIYFGITTNASLLTRELSEKLIDACLKNITLSVSGLKEKYENIHQIDFTATRKNIMDFINISDGRCEIKVSITICDMNRDHIDEMTAIWEKIGIHDFIIFELSNRGGALDRGYYFTKSNRFYAEAEEIMEKNKVFNFCIGPFRSVFIGWDGNYYLCCNDYEKRLPLGNVFEHNIKEIDVKKSNLLRNGCEICRKCDTNNINTIRELFFRLEKKEATVSDLEEKIKELKIKN